MAPSPWLRVFRDAPALRGPLWLLPLAAGTAWSATLTILLARWLWLGRPRYPGQVNPDVPMVSDIASFTFQPVFIAGCAATGAALAGTVLAVHHVRYAPRYYGLVHDSDARQTASLVALAAGLAAAAQLVGLAVFDTFENPAPHRYLLMGALGSLGLTAVLTSAVWWDETWGPPRWAGLRKWCLLNTFLVACMIGLTISFVILMYQGQYRVSGILEWTLTYLGSFWMLSFIGFTKFREGKDPRSSTEPEERPLLSHEE